MEMRSKKLQSATEFMGQYAGALILLVVAISAIAIFATSQHNNTFTGSTCYISPEILCYQQIVSTNALGTYSYVYFTNKQQAPIILSGYNVSFGVGSKQYVGTCNATTLAPGQSAVCFAPLTKLSPVVGSQLNGIFYLDYKLCSNSACSGSSSLPTVAIAGSATVTAIANFTPSGAAQALSSNSISPPTFTTPVKYGDYDLVSGTCPSITDTCVIDIDSNLGSVVTSYAQNGLPTNAPVFGGIGSWQISGGQSSTSSPSFSGAGTWNVIPYSGDTSNSPNFAGTGSWKVVNTLSSGFSENDAVNDIVQVYAYNLGSEENWILSSNSYNATILKTFNQNKQHYSIVLTWPRTTASGYLVYDNDNETICDVGTSNTFTYNSPFSFDVNNCYTETPQELTTNLDQNVAVYAYNLGPTGNFVLSSNSYNATINHTFGETDAEYNVALSWSSTTANGYVVFDTGTEQYCTVTTHNFTYAYNSIGSWDTRPGCGDGTPSNYQSSVQSNVSVYAYNIAADGTYIISSTSYNAVVSGNFDQEFPNYNIILNWGRTTASGYIVFNNYDEYCDVGTSNTFTYNSLYEWTGLGNCGGGFPGEYNQGSYTVGGGGGNLSYTICGGPGNEYPTPTAKTCIAATNYQVKLCDSTISKCSASEPLVVQQANPQVTATCTSRQASCLVSTALSPLQFNASISTVSNQLSANAIESILSANSPTSYLSASNTFTTKLGWLWTNSIIPSINNFYVGVSASTLGNQNYTAGSASTNTLFNKLGPISFVPAPNWSCSLNNTYLWDPSYFAGSSMFVYDQKHGNIAQDIYTINDTALHTSQGGGNLDEDVFDSSNFGARNGFVYVYEQQDGTANNGNESGIGIINVSNYGFYGMVIRKEQAGQEWYAQAMSIGNDGNVFVVYTNESGYGNQIRASEISSAAVQNVIMTSNDYFLTQNNIKNTEVSFNPGYSENLSGGGNYSLFLQYKGALFSQQGSQNYAVVLMNNPGNDYFTPSNDVIVSIDTTTNTVSAPLIMNQGYYDADEASWVTPDDGYIAAAPNATVAYFGEGNNLTRFNIANPALSPNTIELSGEWQSSGIKEIFIEPTGRFGYILDYNDSLFITNLTTGYTQFINKTGSIGAENDLGGLMTLINGTLYVPQQAGSDTPDTGYPRIYEVNLTRGQVVGTMDQALGNLPIPEGPLPICENQNNSYILMFNNAATTHTAAVWSGGTTNVENAYENFYETAYNINSTPAVLLPFSGSVSKTFQSSEPTDGWAEQCYSGGGCYYIDTQGILNNEGDTWNTYNSQFCPGTSIDGFNCNFGSTFISSYPYYVSPDNQTFYGGGMFDAENSALGNLQASNPINAYLAINALTGNIIGHSMGSFLLPSWDSISAPPSGAFQPTFFNGQSSVYFNVPNVYPMYWTGCVEIEEPNSDFCYYGWPQENIVQVSSSATSPSLFANLTVSLANGLGSGEGCSAPCVPQISDPSWAAESSYYGVLWTYGGICASGSCAGGSWQPGSNIDGVADYGYGYYGPVYCCDDGFEGAAIYLYAGHSSSTINYVVYINALAAYQSPYGTGSGYPTYASHSGYYLLTFNSGGTPSFTLITGLPVNTSSCGELNCGPDGGNNQPISVLSSALYNSSTNNYYLFGTDPTKVASGVIYTVSTSGAVTAENVVDASRSGIGIQSAFAMPKGNIWISGCYGQAYEDYAQDCIYNVSTHTIVNLTWYQAVHPSYCAEGESAAIFTTADNKYIYCPDGSGSSELDMYDIMHGRSYMADISNPLSEYPNYPPDGSGGTPAGITGKNNEPKV